MKKSSSRNIIGGQQEIHEDLFKIIDKHLNTVYQKPILDFNRIALKSFENFLAANDNKSFILDLGCGTGMSSINIAKANPKDLVIGVDRSMHRLSKLNQDNIPKNLLFLRADIEDFIRLLKENNYKAAKLYLLYPNPYPKRSQINKRWYAHALFKVFIDISECIELRSNWKMYMEEFALSLKHLGISSELKELAVEQPISAFEQKYSSSSFKLYQLLTN